MTLVALFDCAADEEGELSFRKGDLIEIVDTYGTQWYKGRLSSGEVGVVPMNYVG